MTTTQVVEDKPSNLEEQVTRAIRSYLLTLFLALSMLSIAGDLSAAEPVVPEPSIPAVDLKVENFDEGWRLSRENLVASYASLLDREDFSLHTDIDETLVDWVVAEAVLGGRLSAIGVLKRYVLPVGIVFLLFLSIAGLGRRLLHTAHRHQASADLHTIEWVNALYRTVVVVVARTFPVMIALGLSFFPIQAIFGRAPWTQALSAFLWVYLVWRATSSLTTASVGFRLIRVSDASARKLLVIVSWGLRVILAWMAVGRVLLALEAPRTVLDWIGFMSIASVALVAATLLSVRDEVVEVVAPSRDEDGRFAQVVRRYYFPTMGATAVLLFLAALGYWNASFFILTRVYGILILLFGAVHFSHLMSRAIQNRVEAADSSDEADLYKSIGGMARIGAVLALATITVRLFLLDHALRAFFGTPFLTLGKISIAPLHLFDGVVVIFLALLASRVVRAVMLSTVFPKMGVDVGVGYAVNTLLNYGFIFIGFFVGLSVLGVDLTSMTVVLASLGVGIGLGLQTLTENLVSGFILLFGRSVKKGDVITVNGMYGRVEDVGARSVILRTPDNYDMLVPSKSLVNGEVINWSYRDPFIRLHVPVGVSYSANPREVERVLVRAALAHSRVQPDPPPEVWLKDFGDSAVNFELLVYYDLREITRDRLRGELNFVIWDMLHDAGIQIPFPQRDVHIKTEGAFPELAQAIEKLAATLDKKGD